MFENRIVNLRTGGCFLSKALVVGDLHLHDKEMKSTKKMVENNEVMLSNIYDTLVADTEIKLLIFIGDIQHYTPRNLGVLSKWLDWFRKFGELMLERTPHNLKVVERPGVVSPAFKYPVFSLKGNHDSEIRTRSASDFTFFDMLLKNGLIQNPKGLVFNDGPQLVYYDFRNYGDALQSLPSQIDENYIVVALFHDVLMHEHSPSWMTLALDESHTYPAKDCLVGVDFGVLGHIHDPEDIVEVLTDDGETTPLWQLGSMGRTSTGSTNFRDVGYCLTIDTSNEIDVNRLEIPVIPAAEYFDFSTKLVKERQKNAYKDFNLNMETLEISQKSIYDDILETDIESSVKDAAIAILKRVDDNEEKE